MSESKTDNPSSSAGVSSMIKNDSDSDSQGIVISVFLILMLIFRSTYKSCEN